MRSCYICAASLSISLANIFASLFASVPGVEIQRVVQHNSTSSTISGARSTPTVRELWSKSIGFGSFIVLRHFRLLRQVMKYSINRSPLCSYLSMYCRPQAVSSFFKRSIGFCISQGQKPRKATSETSGACALVSCSRAAFLLRLHLCTSTYVCYSSDRTAARQVYHSPSSQHNITRLLTNFSRKSRLSETRYDAV